MKKIILFIFLQIICISQIFALDIEINTQKKQYDLNENILVNIEISSEENWNISIENIAWIDNFSQYGSSQSQEIININGKISTKNYAELILRAKQEWIYNIWPIEIRNNEETIESNQVEITVWETENLQNIDEYNEKENISEENKNLEENNSEKNNISQEVTSQNTEKWENNADEKKILENFIESKKLEINYKKFSYYSIWVILFFILFYLFIIKYLENKPKKEIKKIIVEKPEFSQDDFKKQLVNKLSDLENKSEWLSKNDFYTQLNLIFREYFEFLWIQNCYIKSYWDFKKDAIEQKLFWMFEKSYFEEFSATQDSQVQRKQMIMNFMIYLK